MGAPCRNAVTMKACRTTLYPGKTQIRGLYLLAHYLEKKVVMTTEDIKRTLMVTPVSDLTFRMSVLTFQNSSLKK